MDTLNINLEFSKEILAVLDVPESRLRQELRELIVLELVRQGRISAGKGAEMLKKSKAEFISVLAKSDIPYFTESPEELAVQIDVAENKIDGSLL